MELAVSLVLNSVCDSTVYFVLEKAEKIGAWRVRQQYIHADKYRIWKEMGGWGEPPALRSVLSSPYKFKS